MSTTTEKEMGANNFNHIDPFTIEIIKSSLTAVADEMFAAMQRTSMSPIIYETLDYSVGITTATGDLITQGNGVTTFLGMIDAQVCHVLEKYHGDIHDGDVFLSNDVYTGGGTHLSDPAIVSPVFYENQLIAFMVNKAHWTEVGGMNPGSTSTTAVEIFQEGLQIPNVRVMQEGEIVRPVLEIIQANSRLPEMTIGDLWAGIAANGVGRRRLLDIYQRYSVAAVTLAMDKLLDYGEAMAKVELKNLPQGCFEAVDYIDNDGVGNGPLEVRVKVTITGEKFVADFTGSAAQAKGPINCSRTGLVAAVRVIFKALTNPQIPANGGAFRSIEVICPDKTVFTAQHPAPVSIYWETLVMATDLIWKAMAVHCPESLTAGHLLSVCATNISSTHPDSGEFNLSIGPLVGGWGAGIDVDGQSGQFSSADGETYNQPLEIMENRYGVLVEEYAFHNDDGGEGRKRGGKGVSLKYRIRAEDAILTASFGRCDFPAWGVDGGRQGSSNYIEIYQQDGEVKRLNKPSRLPLKQGDLIRLVTATGGGWGDPRKRDFEMLQKDLRNGFITEAQLKQYYS